nr:glutathione S-transferase T3-like [Aegilops tauschii subsp. strangulata]
MARSNNNIGPPESSIRRGEKEEEDDDDDLDDTVGDPKKKGRGDIFNMREDELLCDAWLASSLDPVHGTEQKGTTFWRNIHIWFHEHKHFAPYSDALICNREWKSLNHRWYHPRGHLQPTRACVVYKKLEKKSFTYMHCWLKLNGQPKLNLFIAKTSAQANEVENGDPTDPVQEPPKKIRRNLWGKKCEEERANREGAAAKLTERFEEILAKKEETCVRRSDIKEERKAERFKQLMEVIENKIKLQERRAMIEQRKATLEEKKAMLEEKRMLEWQKDELAAAEEEGAVEAEVDANAEAAYAAATTAP